MEHVNDLFLHGKTNFPNSMYIMSPILKYFYLFIYIYTQYNTFTNLEGYILNLKYDLFLGGGIRVIFNFYFLLFTYLYFLTTNFDMLYLWLFQKLYLKRKRSKTYTMLTFKCYPGLPARHFFKRDHYCRVN